MKLLVFNSTGLFFRGDAFSVGRGVAATNSGCCLGCLLVLQCLLGTAWVRADEQAVIWVDSVVLRPLQAAEVPSRQTGLLNSIEVGEGQLVEEGKILASLDAREARLEMAKAKLQSAQAESKAKNLVRIQYARKALEVAKAELQRSNESIEKFPKSISQSQVDVERLTIEKLELELQQAEHELELARFDLDLAKNEIAAAELYLSQHQLRAPFKGTVVLVRGRVGEWVEIGAPVLRLVATDRLRAEGFLPAESATEDLVGRPVRFLVGAGENTRQVSGVVRFVSPEMDPVTRQVRVWAELPGTDGKLRPGQQGSMKILAK